jgi:tetratricopeptide (TPR) repeat protein
MARVSGFLVLPGLLFLGSLSFPTSYAQGGSSLTGAAFSASAADLKAAAAAMPASKEHPAEILYEEANYKFAADGTMTYQHRLIYRVDSEEAVKDWAEISSSWDPWFEKQVQLHARVLETSGKFLELDQKTITDAPVKAEDSETFSSERERRAPLPGMAVGAIVEEQEITEEKTPYFAYGSLERYRFRESVPVARARIVVEEPVSMPFHEKVIHMPGLTVDRSEHDGVRRVVFEALNRDATYDADINLSTNDPLWGEVQFATGESWASVAQHYAAMTEPQTVTAEAEAMLPKDLPADRMAKIRAIVKTLHHEVRYTGVEFGAAKLTPMRPAEVMKRHYGDCKDKANLLVAMLRAAGIRANLALLLTGPDRDVTDDLPGMNQFDHAIVYVPGGAQGESPLWIDATAEHDAVGTLPYADKGRNALVVSAETKGLTRTPDAKPEDSILVETRTFKLAEYGPAHVDEVSDTQGWMDASYRSLYGGPETPKIREDMDSYVKNAFLAKKLTKIEHGDAGDLDKPFRLTLSADGAKRGNSSLTDAVVVVFPTGTLNNLPKWFSEKPAVIGPDTTPEEKREIERSHKARPERVAVRPFVYEQKSRILIPVGFEVRTLPSDKTTPIGPGSLTESYKTVSPGVVEVSFKFNTGPAEITAAEALAMRDAVLEVNKRDYVVIYFDQSGMKELSAGHIREALEIDRKLIAESPADALHHMQFSRALLMAGIGSEAQKEAQRGTELDPKLSAAYSNLGWVLQHNALGERFGKGFDLKGSVAAYGRAVELDPEDSDARYDLAILLEHDANGSRYAEDADLAGSIKTYKDLIELNKDKGDQAVAQYRENLLYTLLYAKQYAELDKLLTTLPSDNNHLALAITSAAAQHGSAAGIAQADKGNVSVTDRNRNLRVAGTEIANLHLYKEAADLVSAGMQGGDDAATAARSVELYRGLKAASLKPPSPGDPASPVQTGLVGIMAGTLTHAQAKGMMSRHAYSSDAALERDANKAVLSSGFLRMAAAKSGMKESVLLDLILGNTTSSAKGDDEKGWDILAQIPGAKADHTYVVKEDGVYRIAADGNADNVTDNTPLGNEVIWALSQGKTAGAKAMLDWKRDLQHKGGGDDPFEGSLMPRFWTIGSTKPGADSPEAMRLAAIALLAGSMDAKPYLAEIAALRERASGQRQTDLDILLATAAIYAEDPSAGMPAVQRLLAEEPDSLTALRLAGHGYALQGDSASWLKLIGDRLAKKPGDHDLLEQQAAAYEAAHDWKAAQATLQKVLDTGKATAADYNSYAWLGLFHDRLGDDITKAAQQSAQMGKNSSFGELHTLACIDAAQGKTTEAREVLKQAMLAASLSEPNSAVWYALGMIYEQYGAKDAALAAYRKVEAHEEDDHTYVDPVSTYVLAQARIGEMAK